MNDVMVDRAPRVRCYECGDHSIYAVCHHCQRPMCVQHTKPVLREDGQPVPPGKEPGENARPISREFGGLRLTRQQEAVYHCIDHAHTVHGIRSWLIAGGVLAALGVLLLSANAILGVPLLLVGVVVAAGAYSYRRIATAGSARPKLPIVPQIKSIEITERLTGHVRLDGAYTSTVTSIAGAMTVKMSAERGQAQRGQAQRVHAERGHKALSDYRRRFGVSATEPVEFAGGFLILQGDAGLAFRAGQPSVLPGGVGLSLGGMADGHPFFPTHSEREQREASLVVDYDVHDARTPREIPLWIVPTLVPLLDRRSMEIDLHWNPIGPRDNELSLTSFELIELEVPASWGNVENSDPGRPEVGRSDGRRVIRWRQVKPANPGDTSRSLKLRFERSITEVPEWLSAADPGSADGEVQPRLTLSGKIEATFAGLVSGVTGVGVYLPGGGPGTKRAATTQTKVTVAFDVSLRSVRYQHVRLVPDENNASDVVSGRNQPAEFVGVVPDDRTVAALTSALSANDFYVKSVVEHQPNRDDGRQGVVNRVWDVAGRRYFDLFPVDFDINLRGEALSLGGLAGRTLAQVTVKGAYAVGTLVEQQDDDAAADGRLTTVEADDVGDELLTRIEQTWASLDDLVTRILGSRRTGIPAVTMAADDTLSGEVISSTVDEPDVNGSRGDATYASSGAASRADELRRQRQAAHDEMARIEAELGEMGE